MDGRYSLRKDVGGSVDPYLLSARAFCTSQLTVCTSQSLSGARAYRLGGGVTEGALDLCSYVDIVIHAPPVSDSPPMLCGHTSVCCLCPLRRAGTFVHISPGRMFPQEGSCPLGIRNQIQGRWAEDCRVSY